MNREDPFHSLALAWSVDQEQSVNLAEATIHSISSPFGVVQITVNRGFLTGLRFQEPTTKKIPAPPHAMAWKQEILDHIPRRSIHVHGTRFQITVWKELVRIPHGETRTYGEVATAVGKPAAARAVGQAIGKNPMAMIIPCHRVIRTDGSTGGYAWGIPVKEALLHEEIHPRS